MIDPRILERRVQVARDDTRRRRRRWRWVVIPVVLPLVVVAAVVGLAHTPPLAVARVGVEGAAETPEHVVLQAARIDEGQAMLTLDTGAVGRRVAELPWVEEVDVVRDWPSTVRIKVTERTAVAIVVDERAGTSVLVDETGHVLRAPTMAELTGTGGSATSDLIFITGLDEVPEPGDKLAAEAHDALAIAARAPARVPGTLAEISVDLDAVIADGRAGAGAVVSFRSGDSIDERLVALDTLLTKADMSCLATVDLWLPDRPVITRHPGC